MLKIAAITATLSLFLVQAEAQEFSYFNDASTLWRACESDKPFAYGIVSGIHDAYAEAYASTGASVLQLCSPEDATPATLTRMVCDQLDTHPNLRQLTAAQAVTAIIYSANPC